MFPDRLSSCADQKLCVANHSSFPQSPQKLRCDALELSTDCFRHHALSEEESFDSHTEWSVNEAPNNRRPRLEADYRIGIVSAPLWDSKLSTFAGLLTTSDYINVIQYYWQHPEEMNRIDQFRLDSLRGTSWLGIS